MATNRVANWLYPALQRANELIQMVVVVPGHDRQDRIDREPAADWMDAALLPLHGREPGEELQRLRPAPPKGGERFLGVAAQVLPFFGHAVGVRVAPSRVDVHDPDLLDACRE